MKRLFLLLVIAVFFFIFLDAFAYYSFLSPECNTFIEELKEKYRVKQIISVKEEGIVWIVTLPKNSGVETNEVKEEVYDETGKPEGMYNFTNITIINPKGWTKVVWGSAAKACPYDVPRIHFIFNLSFNNLFPEENTWVSDDGTLTVTEGPKQEWWDKTIIWSHVTLESEGGETLLFTIPSIIPTDNTPTIKENKGAERTLFLFILLYLI